MPDADGLASIVLPEALGLRRDRVVPAHLRTAAFDAGYDFTTLVYDAVSLDGQGVWLFCPKLVNLESPLRAARIEIDGVPARVRRIRRFERYDIAEIPCATPARRMAIVFAGWRAELDLSPDETATFAGLNCLLTLSRNNDLAWIRDWVRFHVREHGAEAMLFYDNFSHAYGTGDILAALEGIEGLKAVRVLRMPFLYGPQASKKKKFLANFLQAALLNLARWRFLARARAVLSCDVDEMVFRNGGASIFDATCASRAGFLRVPGVWRFPDVVEGVMPMHRDHYMRGADEATCPAKYCVVPSGPLRGKSWATHGLHGVLFSRRFVSEEFTFLHCYGISDFWKGRPNSNASRATLVDERARETFARLLPVEAPQDQG
ncbi:MAG: hypothetical protein KDK03_15125 [Rhodobacteraceae bacterium]|nr:hypothetical protein [Paracoccaceae bacterium]